MIMLKEFSSDVLIWDGNDFVAKAQSYTKMCVCISDVLYMNDKNSSSSL